MLTAADSRDDRHGQILDPVGQIGEELGRGRIGPVEVIDADDQRVLGRQVGHQPVEPVQHGEGPGGYRGSGAGHRRGCEQWHGQVGGTRQQLPASLEGAAGEEALEQLADHPVGKVPLEAGRPGPGGGQAEVAGEVGGLAQQRRLPDASGPIENHNSADATGGRRDRLPQRGDLILALHHPGANRRQLRPFWEDPD